MSDDDLRAAYARYMSTAHDPGRDTYQVFAAGWRAARPGLPEAQQRVVDSALAYDHDADVFGQPGGEVIVLADAGTRVISVSRDGMTSSAYLVADDPGDDVTGWESGWRP